jgi:glucose/arabinose dehydrogenase
MSAGVAFRGVDMRIRTTVAWMLCGLLLVAAAGSAQAAFQVPGQTVLFEWAPASGPVEGYVIYVSRDGGAFNPEASQPATSTSQEIYGQVGETLQVQVAAFDVQGNLGPRSTPSSPVQFAGALGTPGNPLATEISAALDEPVYAASTGSDGRLFVVERAGRIRILENGQIFSTDFLNIQSRVGTAGEGGLWGLAFDPDFARSGLFYVLYTDPSGDTVVSRFAVGNNANVADPASEEILLTVSQPFDDHNGATLAFSPVDGQLYVALGDGGSLDDPDELAQDGGELLGKMLRLDVSDGVGPYRIPADNPHVGDPDMLEEIWATGLRDPFRFAFDSVTGDLWIADVGAELQEVNLEPAGDAGGRNYGWDVMDGTSCNPMDPAPDPPCDDVSLELPLHEYENLDGNCGITGGTVYRGPSDDLEGQYLFGDFCSGRIWSLDPDTLEVQQLDIDLGGSGDKALAALAEGVGGAVYAVQMTGSVVRIGAGPLECADGIDNDGDGTVDAGDPGCDGPSDASERSSQLACDDGFDNDGDGVVDFPADLSCDRPDSLQEASIFAAAAPAAGGGGSACGIGFELAAILPAIMALRRRRSRRGSVRSPAL